jgi:hypothetical protein
MISKDNGKIRKFLNFTHFFVVSAVDSQKIFSVSVFDFRRRTKKINNLFIKSQENIPENSQVPSPSANYKKRSQKWTAKTVHFPTFLPRLLRKTIHDRIKNRMNFLVPITRFKIKNSFLSIDNLPIKM